MNKILIVGGVAGGASCAARLRRLDEKAEIILFERGDYISYANCGLPYHVGNVIKSRDSLLLQTPETMQAKFNIDVRIRNEVVSIDKDNKSITVKRVDSGETYVENYDILVLSPGSIPFKPSIPGIDSLRIQTIWTIPDTDRIRKMVQGIKTVAIIGGGFIGLEMAENLHRIGLNVTIIESSDQVMPSLDYELAQLLHENITQNKVKLLVGVGVSSFIDTGRNININLENGKAITAELVILSTGIKPNSELAKAAGLKVNTHGGIIVDDYLRTSDPSIFAIGDVIEVEDFIGKNRTMIPLAGPANKQGRIAANNIAGSIEKYEGSQGSSIARVFNLTAAGTGSNEKTLIKRGLVKGKDYDSIIITQNSHASYYPGAVPMTLKLLFSTDGKQIFGAQIVGGDGVDKRIDTIAVAIRLGGGVSDLKTLELAYAPPYSAAKDPVNMAGFMAENVLTSRIVFASWDEVEKNSNALLLDVRENAELLAYSIPNAIHIPLGQLRSRLDELDKSREIIAFCAVGIRAYNAARILMQHGFDKVRLYPGGMRFYRSTHFNEDILNTFDIPVSDSGHVDNPDIPAMNIKVDCSGLQCPGPIMKAFETMKEMKNGQIMEISASDPGFTRDIAAWCRRTGNALLSSEQRGNDYIALVKKGSSDSKISPGYISPETISPESISAGSIPAGNISTGTGQEKNDGKTIVIFSGDLDKVLAGFIIANGAAAMGRNVTMFFTFWGLNVIRKPQKQHVKKSFIETMFGFMMPRGSVKLKLSKMNMVGMGTAMIKKVMKNKNVDSLETLIQKALKAGIKVVACTMSMDIMGIKEEELIDGVELGGVSAYLGDAEESNVNLFI